MPLISKFTNLKPHQFGTDKVGKVLIEKQTVLHQANIKKNFYTSTFIIS